MGVQVGLKVDQVEMEVMVGLKVDLVEMEGMGEQEEVWVVMGDQVGLMLIQ